jgi:phosphotransacetylase/acyl dehydratase
MSIDSQSHVVGERAAQTLVNRTFDEVRVGDSASALRVLNVNDVKAFALLSGDVNPTHVDESYVRRHLDGRLVAHSLWSGALISSLLGNELPGPGTRYVRQTLSFEHPIYAGDSLKVTITVLSKDPGERTIELGCRCENGNGELVASGRAIVAAPTEKIVLPRPDVGKLAIQTYDKFEAMVELAKTMPRVKAAVAHPCSEAALEAAVEAAEGGLIEPILVGPSDRIRQIAAEIGADIEHLRIENAPHSDAAAERAVALVRDGQAQVLIKGSLHTDELLGAVVRRDAGLRTARRLSHVFLMDVPTYHKPIMVTDAAINIAPTLEEKRDIVQNAIDLAHDLLIDRPKVAILSAVETINPRIASTTDAAALCKMAERGQITGAVLDGPLAMDNAISRDAAAVKGIQSAVAGDVDILLVPDLESGNILAKQLTFMANADAAGIVLGARVPIILTSRADSVRARMTSCAIAVMLTAARGDGGERRRSPGPIE